jgi:hypothetical protein
MAETQAPPQSAAPRGVIFLTTSEFFWLTLAVWIGGVFILTLMPYLLIPRVGGAMSIAGSYLLFFLAWQPIQSITQRTFGIRAGIVRMVIFVAGAAAFAAYLRQALPSLTGAS